LKGPSKRRFQEIYDRGQRVSGPLCRVLFLQGEGRLGFATAKAIGNVPKRNRVKRRFRAAMSEVPACIPEGADVVVQISAKGAEASYEHIVDDLRDILSRVNERWANERASSS
jgi:ribonuclease P protein component